MLMTITTTRKRVLSILKKNNVGFKYYVIRKTYKTI